MQGRGTHEISTIWFPKEELHNDNINRNESMIGLFQKASTLDQEIHSTNDFIREG